MWLRSSLSATALVATNSHQQKKRRHRGTTGRLRLEALESRCLLTFMAPVDYPVGQGPRAVVAADLADNGVQDLVTCNNVDSTVSVLLGNGNGTFQPARTFATGSNPWSVTVGDLTGNGKLDIVTGNRSYSLNGASVSVLLGNGDGTFKAPFTFALPNMRSDVISVAVGDMNHDGHPDLVVAGDSSTSPSYGVVDVLLGHEDGTFSLASTTNLSGSWIASVKLADFNGNGNLDVAATVGTSSSVSVLMGNGNGTLDVPTYFATGTNPGSLAVGDLKGDGKLDLVTANYGSNAYSMGSVTVLMGNGDGSFQPATNVALPSVSSGGFTISRLHAQGVVMGDLNGDGKMDLAVSGAYSYSEPVTYYYNGTPYPDTATVTQHAVNVLLGNGDGTFTHARTILLNGTNPYSITAANFNGGTLSDLAAADAWANTVSVLLNGTTAQPSSFSVSGFPASTQAGTAGTFTVTALNADGTVDTGYTGTVRFSSSDGQAALPAAYTFTAADAGKHTFSATLKTAGSQSIAVADTLAPDVMGSEISITVIPAAASHFAVSAPTSSTAGNSFSVTLTALDPYNNTATGYAGTVHFISSDAKAVLPGNYTFTSADAGKHTFSATLKTAGTQSISATDTVNASLHGTESGITVKPAAASKFVLSAPASVQPGVPFSLTVTVEDAYGNIVTGYVGTVHFSSGDSQAHLPANYTFKASDNGVHTFTGLVLRKTGNQTITATDTKNTGITGKTVVDVV